MEVIGYLLLSTDDDPGLSTILNITLFHPETFVSSTDSLGSSLLSDFLFLEGEATSMIQFVPHSQ
jgi:hypothetical protein